MSSDTPLPNNIIFYSTPGGDVKIEVVFNDETFWLSQKKMGELFGVDVRTVNEHLQNIYKTAELEKEATIRKIRIVQKEGNREVSRELDYYNPCPCCCLPSVFGVQIGITCAAVRCYHQRLSTPKQNLNLVISLPMC